MITGKLLEGRYFYDLNNSGLIWDTYPIFRNVAGEDEDGLNERIGEANKYLESIMPTGRDWKCSLHLTLKQYNDLPERYKQMFADKTYLFLYLPAKLDLYEIDCAPWNAYNRDAFIWNGSNNDVKCQYYDNALTHRFYPLKEAERDEILKVVIPPVPVTPPTGGTTPPAISAKKWHIKGKIWFMDVDITAEAEE